MTDDRPYKRPESVLVVVYTGTGKVLLLRRADHPEFWQSITGSMEWDDATPVATAVRELREETGIQVTAPQLRDWHIQQRYVLFPQWRHKYAPEISENTGWSARRSSSTLPVPVYTTTSTDSGRL